MSIDKKSNYYDGGGIETIEVMRAKLTPEQFEGFLLGNILKYSCRANFKGCFERDIDKVGVYQQLLRHHRKVMSKKEEEDSEAPPTVKNCASCARYDHKKEECERTLVQMKPHDSCEKWLKEKNCGTCAYLNENFWCRIQDTTRSAQSLCDSWDAPQ